MNDTEKNVEIKPTKKSLEDPVQDIKRYLNIIALKRKNDESQTKSEISKSLLQEKIEKNKKRKSQTSTDDLIDDAHKSKKKKTRLRKSSSSDSEKSIKKHKRHKKHKKSKKQKHKNKDKLSDVEKLRAERLKRELQEKLRAQELLISQKGLDNSNSKPAGFKQKYSSQFFPELARQNCEKYNRS